MLYSSIDTLHVIYYDSTIENIFDHLGLPKDNVRDLFKIGDDGECANVINRGYRYELKFNYQNIWIHCNCLTVDYRAFNPDNFFTFCFSDIRVEFTGQGIEFLRTEGFDPDLRFTQESFWQLANCNFNITRVDFAFDFVNCQNDNFRELFKFTDDWQYRYYGLNKRLFTSVGGGISFQRKSGSEQTLYLGTKGSDKILRVYDKKLERGDRIASHQLPLFIKEDVETWWRVELQLRRSYCERHLFSLKDGDLKPNLLFIFENFSLMKDTEDGKNSKQPLDCWLTLYEWSQIEPLYKMQNPSKISDSEIVFLDRACSFMTNQAGLSNLMILTHSGIMGILQCGDTTLQLIQFDKTQRGRLCTFNSRVCSDADRVGKSITEFTPYLVDENNHYSLNYFAFLNDLLNYCFSLNRNTTRDLIMQFMEDKYV